MFGPPSGILKIYKKPSSLGLKWDGFDANMLSQGLKYYRDYSRALDRDISYLRGEENDHKMHKNMSFILGPLFRRFIWILFYLGPQIITGLIFSDTTVFIYIYTARARPLPSRPRSPAARHPRSPAARPPWHHRTPFFLGPNPPPPQPPHFHLHIRTSNYKYLNKNPPKLQTYFPLFVHRYTPVGMRARVLPRINSVFTADLERITSKCSQKEVSKVTFLR
jgi:hypothetical protein